jgi:hypothetical protein
VLSRSLDDQWFGFSCVPNNNTQQLGDGTMSMQMHCDRQTLDKQPDVFHYIPDGMSVKEYTATTGNLLNTGSNTSTKLNEEMDMELYIFLMKLDELDKKTTDTAPNVAESFAAMSLDGYGLREPCSEQDGVMDIPEGKAEKHMGYNAQRSSDDKTIPDSCWL